MNLKAGDLLSSGRYCILRLLSDAGGMGVVYEARDGSLGDVVVIKQSRFSNIEALRPNPNFKGSSDVSLLAELADLQKDFEREAKLLRRLRHQAFPTVFDYFKTAEGEQFLVMELIHGDDLEELLQKQRPTVQQALDWADQILDALHYLHTNFEEPVFHRDIKPQNLKLRPNGKITLLDFGLAKGAVDGMSKPMGSVPGGSENYAPLEQSNGVGTDERSDLYSLAVTTHHLLTGQRPPKAGVRAMQKLMSQPDPLQPAHELNRLVTPVVSACLQQAAAIEPDQRFASAAAMRAALKAARTAATEPVQPTTTHRTVAPTPPPVQRNRFEIPLAPPTPKFDVPPERIVQAKPLAPESLRPPIVNLKGGVKLELLPIPGGAFDMGSNEYDDEKPIHRVTVAPFYLGKFQVTQAQWLAVMGGENPSRFKGDDLPVERVSWEDAVRFCETLSAQTGRVFRLPSEAEWEYACRAGSSGKWCFGDDEKLLKQYAWYDENSGSKTHPVGQKRANEFGLFDMHGNVWEWCADWYGDYASSNQTDSSGPTTGKSRVLRGGSWYNYSRNCRSAVRVNYSPGYRLVNVGFRVVIGSRTP